MIVTSHATSGPIVSEMKASRVLTMNSAMIEPITVSVSRTLTVTESVAACPTCSVLYVSRDSSTLLELRS